MHLIGSLLRVLTVATVLLISAWQAVIPQAAAEPPETDATASGESLTIPWKLLGLPSELNFLTAGSNQELLVPLPPGTRAQRLRGRVDLPVDSPPGYLEITDNQGTFLASVDLPPASAGRVSFPFDADIAGAQATGSAIGLSLTLHQINDELRCRPREQLVVADLATVYAGEEPAPTTIATFFPPVLERVDVYAPADADQSEQQAVLTLTSELARTYAPQPVRVTVRNQPRGATPPPPGPRSRAVVVERGPAGLTVVGEGGTVHLRLSGRGDELSRQVSVLDNELQGLAQVPSMRVDQAGSVTEEPTETMTFRQLNMEGSTEILGGGNLTVGVDRAALGTARVERVRVHLLADYTPVGADDTGTVAVTVNGDAYVTRALDGSGRLDTTFELPSEALSQRINLDFELGYTPHLPCSALSVPMRFWVDPESTLTMQGGGTPAGDFASLPSEFRPDFLVAFDGSGPDQLGYAAEIVASLAGMTTAKLTPRVVDLPAAVDSETGALIVARTTALEGSALQLPVGGSDSAIDVDLPTQLRADIARGIGSVQAFADHPHDRTVLLVTTTASWNLVPPVLDHLANLRGGWADLTGNVVAAGAQGTPTDLSIPVGLPESAPETRSPGWALWAGIGVAVVAAAALGFWALRRRRAAESRA